MHGSTRDRFALPPKLRDLRDVASDAPGDGDSVVWDASRGLWVPRALAPLVNPMTSTGDLIVGGTDGVPSRLPVGPDGKLLGVASGEPAWVDALSGGSGTVTSVALTAPAEITVTGSPVESTGTLAIGWASEAANKVLASPDGSSGVPTFRALAPSDIPALDASKVASGTVSVARLPSMGASGSGHAAGVVPDPPSSAGSTKYLREDATWAAPASGGGGATPAISGAFTVSSYGTLDLTSIGAVDWVCFNGQLPVPSIASFLSYRKRYGGSILSCDRLGYNDSTTFSGGGAVCSWTDGSGYGAGAVTATQFNYVAVSKASYPATGVGYIFRVMARSTPLKLRIYFGRWQTGCKVTCRLSDGSMADLVDTTSCASATSGVNVVGYYEVTFNSPYPGVVLTVTIETTVDAGSSSNVGNMAIHCLTLST